MNQAQPPVPFDLFDVKQRQGEPLKDFLNRFGAFVVRLQTQDEALMVHAFGQGIMSGPFSDLLIRNRARTFGEIQRRAVAHIATEEAVTVVPHEDDPMVISIVTVERRVQRVLID